MVGPTIFASPHCSLDALGKFCACRTQLKLRTPWHPLPSRDASLSTTYPYANSFFDVSDERFSKSRGVVTPMAPSTRTHGRRKLGASAFFFSPRTSKSGSDSWVPLRVVGGKNALHELLHLTHDPVVYRQFLMDLLVLTSTVL